MSFAFGRQQSDRSWRELCLSGSHNNDDDDEADDKWVTVNKTLVQQPAAPLCRRSWVFFRTIVVLSCDGLAFSKWNQSVRGDPPQHWSQEQTECGDAENQQVHLEGKPHLSALIALKGSLL